MSDLNGIVLVAVVACVAIVGGCRDAGQSSESAAAPGAGANASTPPDADRAEGRVAFKVSGVKKTASGAT